MAYTEDQIKEVIENSGIELIKNNMGLLIKTIKEVYPTVDGKLASEIVRNYLS